MGYRLAKSLSVLRDQIDAQWPDRNKASDGWIGDTAHASRKSDHNAWVRDEKGGVVTALDVTHDPAHGVDCNRIADSVKDDPRVKYVIWNRKIWNPSVSKSWRQYSGSNPHTKHVHISVLPDKGHYDSANLWPLDTYPISRPEPPKPLPGLVKRGMRGEAVKLLQSHLNTIGMTPVLKEDGIFGPNTERNVRAFQKEKGLVVDGIVGPYTWGALLGDD